MNTVLTIAGSDSSGGAGIQADLKVISLLGGYGMSVITALTAQNTQGVLQVHAIPAEFVERQFEAVCSDIQVDAAKTGMLYSEGIIEVVDKNVKKYDIAKLVIDPVMVAKDGSSLLFPKAHESFIKDLIPLCFVITPNLHEASILTGIEVNGISEMEQSA